MLRFLLVVVCVLQFLGDKAIVQSKAKDPMSWKDILNKAGPQPPVQSTPQQPSYQAEPGDELFGLNPLKVVPPEKQGSFSKPQEERPQQREERGKLRVVNVGEYDVLYMRELPSEISRILGMIPPDRGGIQSLGKQEGNWILVRYDGIEGWVNIRFIAEENE
jgi:hypothetical protein